jgi:hypothetical protein
MKPRVGLTLFTSSFIIFLTMVVFPALSRPLCKVLTDKPWLQLELLTAWEFSSPCPSIWLSLKLTAFWCLLENVDRVKSTRGVPLDVLELKISGHVPTHHFLLGVPVVLGSEQVQKVTSLCCSHLHLTWSVFTSTGCEVLVRARRSSILCAIFSLKLEPKIYITDNTLLPFLTVEISFL